MATFRRIRTATLSVRPDLILFWIVGGLVSLQALSHTVGAI